MDKITLIQVLGALASIFTLFWWLGARVSENREIVENVVGGFLWLVSGLVTWKRVAILLMDTLAAILVWPPATQVLYELHREIQISEEERRQRLESLRTKPVCAGQSCGNWRWKVDKCRREALEVGVRTRNRLGDVLTFSVEKGTEYFRGCLANENISWENCKPHERNCLLIDYKFR